MDEYLTLKEVPWILSLLLSAIMQQKTVFDSYLRYWRNEHDNCSVRIAKNKNDTANVIKQASVGIMLTRAIIKIRDISLLR